MESRNFVLILSNSPPLRPFLPFSKNLVLDEDNTRMDEWIVLAMAVAYHPAFTRVGHVYCTVDKEGVTFTTFEDTFSPTLLSLRKRAPLGIRFDPPRLFDVSVPL